MFKYIFLLFTLTIAACSSTQKTNIQANTTNSLKCNSENAAEDIPWIREFASNYADGRNNAEIKRYEVDGDYYFSVNNCVNCADAMLVIYTCDHGKYCEKGGIAGLDTCKGLLERAGKGEVVWRNYEPSERSKY